MPLAPALILTAPPKRYRAPAELAVEGIHHAHHLRRLLALGFRLLTLEPIELHAFTIREVDHHDACLGIEQPWPIDGLHGALCRSDDEPAVIGRSQQGEESGWGSPGGGRCESEASTGTPYGPGHGLLAAYLLSASLRMRSNSLSQILEAPGGAPKRAACHDVLALLVDVIQTDHILAAQLPQGTLQHNAKAPADLAGVGLAKIQGGVDAQLRRSRWVH